MLVPLNWLRDYVDIDVSLASLAEKMTMSGSKVESVKMIATDNNDEEDVIEFEITSNRPDCLSVIGIAREAAVTLEKNLRIPVIKVSRENESISGQVSVIVEDSELCPRYCARVIKDINVRPSPEWMQRRLTAAGVRPINNIVDITNYVMLEMGQPMHAFDLDKVAGKTIVVRRAYEGENIVTLDNKPRTLTSNILMIADVERSIGIAGVMGGADSEISEQTKSILLESAKFNAVSIRLASRALGLRSDASSRFEKGLDSVNTKIAIDRAAQLVQELGVGTVLDGVIDVCADKLEKRVLEVDWRRINKLLSIELSLSRIVDILRSLEFGVEQTDEGIRVAVPSFRADVEGVADLAEEVGRIHGYNNIPMTQIATSATRGSKTRRQKLFDTAKNVLVAEGFYETSTYSFTSPRIYETIGLNDPETFPLSVKIANPLGEDQSIMRTTMLPSILEVLSRNNNRGQQSCRIFEISTAFLPKSLPMKELPLEKAVMCVAGYGNGMDYHAIKGEIELLLDEFGITQDVSFVSHLHHAFHPGRTALVKAEGRDIGVMGEIHPNVAKNYQMEGMRILMAEFDFDAMLELARTDKRYIPLPKYPAVKRDLSLVVDKTLASNHMEKMIRGLAGDLLWGLELFDVYEGSQVPEGCKSMAYSLTYRDLNRTLKDEEVNMVHITIVDGLERELGAKLR